MSGELWIAGGEPSIASAVAEAAGVTGREARVIGSGLPGTIAEGDAVVDLGLPPGAYPRGEGLIEMERDRARRLAEGMPEGVRLVRASILGADGVAATVLQRAQRAAEDAHLAGRADAVLLRSGVLLGPCGLAGALRRGIERLPLLPLPAIAQAKFEPLALTDFARYCTLAAASPTPLDPIYDLGCGEVLTGGLFARGLAENLGISRWIVPVPGFSRPAVAAVLASEDCPSPALRLLLETLSRGLLARRMSAWEHFDLKPVELREGLAQAAGMIVPLREREEGRFSKWRRPPKKGLFWRTKR